MDAIINVFFGGHMFRHLGIVFLGLLTLQVFMMTPAYANDSGARSAPILIAHRGASSYVPEHTLLAVTAAHVMDADFIEQDIVLSKDGVPLVLHDIYLESTSNVAEVFPGRQRADGRWYAIDFTLDEIKRLTVGERRQDDGNTAFSDRFPNTNLALRIPTLEEEIQLILGLNTSRGRNAGLYIEFKAPRFHSAAGYEITTAVLDVLDDYALNQVGANIFLQCFDDLTLKSLRERNATPLPLIQLIADPAWGEDSAVDYDWLRTMDGLAAIAQYADGIGPWLPHLFTAPDGAPVDLVGNAHAAGLVVHPYTLRADDLSLGAETFDALQRRVFIDAGADGAFTDFTDLTRKFIDLHFNSSTGDIES